MDNKLSELSKPVDICNWKMDSWRAAPCNGTEWAKGYFEGWNKYHQKVEGLAPLYSQEYVSALLAELEAKDKRMAELEEEFAFIMGQNDGMEKELRDKDARIEHLANREAQPVGYIAEVSGNRVGVLRGLPMPDVGSLIYTAPPAPTPAPAVQSVVDWRLDESTGAKILMYKDCSVIEDQQAEYVLSLIRSATAAPDTVDIFADQVIGTKTKIIHMPAPLNVPQEGIRVYLNADELFMQLENQGYIVEVSNE
ncbi:MULTISPECIES: hypothetical protein [Serratia]|uniref:hypothetical protein n=1 Tax=Serratia TaxID=613 RepID=UPI0021C686EB|nr:hypothetical protein [Serratia liquefaciens]